MAFKTSKRTDTAEAIKTHPVVIELVDAIDQTLSGIHQEKRDDDAASVRNLVVHGKISP